MPNLDAAFLAHILARARELPRLSYYDILEVGPEVPAADLRTVYYGLVGRLHPDLYGDTLDGPTRERLVSLYSRTVEAYQVLTNPDRRREYDQLLARGVLRWTEEEREKLKVGEESVKNPNALRFFRMGRTALFGGDAKSAVMNLRLALSAEPGSELIEAELARAEAALRSK
jgi:curved DNA-binding protein CbpA